LDLRDRRLYVWLLQSAHFHQVRVCSSSDRILWRPLLSTCCVRHPVSGYAGPRGGGVVWRILTLCNEIRAERGAISVRLPFKATPRAKSDLRSRNPLLSSRGNGKGECNSLKKSVIAGKVVSHEKDKSFSLFLCHFFYALFFI
jgi:hypothetical protein